MNEKEFFIGKYRFVLRFMDQELLDRHLKGRVRAFFIDYKPQDVETEAQTVELLERFEDDFLREIYKLINQNPEWYKRFEIYRSFDGGWSGGYDNVGRVGTLYTDRCLLMSVRQ